ncbi:MAG: haloacid dehalogenase-like hydrolase [Candidatus Nanohaloarchaea archaeon]
MSARDSHVLDPASSHEKIGSPVVHLPDFDGTVYNGDVGQLAAEHEESHVLGFRDIDDFLGKVDKRRSNRPELSRGSEKANIIEENSTGDVEEIERILTESQDPDRIKTGFQDVAPELYRRGNLVEVVTAGVDIAARNILNGSMASVTGARLKQNGDGVEVEQYCGRREKPYRVGEVLEEEGVEDATPIAVGDSSTDGDYMKESLEAGGQAIAIEPGAVDYASIDASGDADYETVSVLHVIMDELYSTGSREQAKNRAENYLEDRDYDLADVEATHNWNAMTLEGLSVYEEVK